MVTNSGNAPSISPKRGYSIRDLCAAFGVSKGFVLAEIKRGKLPARRFGRRVIVLHEDLAVYLESGRKA